MKKKQSSVTIKHMEDNIFIITVADNEFKDFGIGDYVFIKKTEYEIVQKVTDCMVYAKKSI